MPRLSDPAEIRALLETDRPWAAYALGDLSPGFFEQSEWFRTPAHPALALVLHAFATPVLFTLGPPGAMRMILEEIDEPELYLMVRPEILPLIKARYRVQPETAMWRMTLDPTHFRPAPLEDVARLGPADVAVLQRLYAGGEPAGEAPGCFHPSMLEQGVFFGIREGEELVAAAGTHLVVPAEGVGAIGSIYTRQDRRGQGLARRVTSAVAAELLRLGLQTVALNVSQTNNPAVRVYERLGFARYCPFFEGVAVRS